MQFIVDEQLPPALARWLVAQGHQAKHVLDLGLESASDSAIWNYALAHGFVLITKDEDFPQRKAVGDGGPAVVWVRLRNSRRRDLLIWFENVLPDLLVTLERGETLIEII